MVSTEAEDFQYEISKISRRKYCNVIELVKIPAFITVVIMLSPIAGRWTHPLSGLGNAAISLRRLENGGLRRAGNMSSLFLPCSFVSITYIAIKL
jgi:hypothetical protein